MSIRSFGLVVGSLVCAAVVGTSFAGKPERDRVAELKPKVAAAESAAKAACGCAAKINVKWDSFAKADDMFRVPETLDDVVAASKTQCTNADNKKAMCKGVTGYEIEYSKEGGSATLKGKTIVLTTSDMGHPGDHLITAIVEKF